MSLSAANVGPAKTSPADLKPEKRPRVAMGDNFFCGSKMIVEPFAPLFMTTGPPRVSESKSVTAHSPNRRDADDKGMIRNR